VSAEIEVVAVPLDASPDAIRRLGGEPPVLFPIVTEGAADIVRTYTMLSGGPRAESPSQTQPAEFLIDRQGYLRAISAGERRWSDTNALFAQIEQLNDEKSSVPMASEHAH
jgi:hypothetical protein